MGDDTDERAETVQPLKQGGSSPLDRVFEERKKNERKDVEKALKEAEAAFKVFRTAYSNYEEAEAKFAAIDDEKKAMKHVLDKL